MRATASRIAGHPSLASAASPLLVLSSEASAIIEKVVRPLERRAYDARSLADQIETLQRDPQVRRREAACFRRDIQTVAGMDLFVHGEIADFQVLAEVDALEYHLILVGRNVDEVL